MPAIIIVIGVIAVVLIISALASGLVDRAPLSFPMIFLGLGFLLGGGGLGVLVLEAEHPMLEAVSTISLALVLFLDAMKIRIEELRKDWFIPFLTLGPGTLLTIGGVAAAALLLLGMTPVEAILLGAILASTDPVVLRDVLRDVRIPRSVRRALSVEAGMNDIVVLPIVLILIAVLAGRISSAGDAGVFLVQVLLLSPIIGAIVGGSGAWLMAQTNRRYGIRTEFQALYGIGLVLGAYAAAQAVGGSGFLAAFFAGLVVTLFNMELCTCFMDYGEVTSEMLMLLAFVLFGAVLSTLFSTVPIIPIVGLALIAIGIIRPVSMWLVLQRAKMSNLARGFIGWFGPRGLTSLLLALLVVQAQAPDAERLLAIAGVVVVVSVILHGITATPLSNWYGQRVALETLQEERESTFSNLFESDPDDIERYSPGELDEMLKSDHPPLVLDVRSRSAWEVDKGQIPGSIRVFPDQIEEWALSNDKSRPIVAYCSCKDELTSGRVAHELQALGFKAGVLVGGYRVWEAQGYAVEPKAGLLMPT